MNRFLYFLRHTWAHINRERRRTLFVLFCIAAGVAAVVSLRTLGLMIEASLSGNLQMANQGDMVIQVPMSIGEGEMITLADGREIPPDQTLFRKRGLLKEGQQAFMLEGDLALSESGWARLQDWADGNSFELMPAWVQSGPWSRVSREESGSAGFAIARFIDTQRYPFYGVAELITPADTTLAQAMDGPDDVAVSEDLAEDLGLQVGDTVHVVGSDEPFTVVAIVARRSEATIRDLFNSLFPFLYVPYQSGIDVFQKDPNVFYVKMPGGTDVTTVNDAFIEEFPGLQTTTTEDLRRINETFSDAFNKLATTMGLASLLIGGIGIANTLIVVVSRRNMEIAVLKTVGAESRHIVLLFVVEALVLGLLGSLLGMGLGIGLVFLLRGFGESFVSQSLQLAISPPALAMGLVLGVVVTLVFGLLPILAASRIRPNLVLRPQEGAVPRTGQLVSALVLLALTAVMGFIVGQILENVFMGLLVAYGTVVVLILVTLLLRGLVWLISRLPAFGRISLQLAQRGLDAQQGRAASTILALVAGISSLSLILLLAQGALKQVSNTLEYWIGGNVMIAVQTIDAGAALESKVETLPGVLAYTHDTVYQAEIVAVDGDRDIAAWIEQAWQASAGGGVVYDVSKEYIEEFVGGFTMKVLEDDTWDYEVVQGQDIADQKRQIVVPTDHIILEPSVYDHDDFFAWLGLQPGTTITLRFHNGEERTATIAGITAKKSSGVLAISNFRETYSIVPPGFAPEDELPIPSFYGLTIDEERMNESLTELSEIPGLVIVEASMMQVFSERFAEQFAPLPLIVAALALFASATIIANTVSLATMERRREIGIMKALGLQAEKVLGLLLLENSLVGLAGGVLGVGLGTAIIVAFDLLGQRAGNLPVGALLGLIVLAVALSMGATALTAWGPAREKPLHVLRYE